MLVYNVKPIGKIGKNILNQKNSDKLIESIIEKPLQEACKLCKKKNIETVMSSANRKNIIKNEKKIINKKDVIEKLKSNKIQTFLEAGKGYAWLMLNYKTLSYANKEKLFMLENLLGEDTIWFVKSSYEDFINHFRRIFKIKENIEIFEDPFAEQFKNRQLKLMYNNKYPSLSVFIRMPIDVKTTIEDVEEYFEKIISNLETQ